ncbi:MAG: hypothetical protein IJ335_09250 [Lachnospiraceae bacterium]|nr:hypothetical protein [Lachnospiraceae bacterium]
MRKVCKHGSALLGRMIWLGMGLQVLLGFIWLLSNIGAEHSFGVDWSNGGPVNRAFMHWGALYGWVIRLVMQVAQWVPIPYYSIVYCLQLLAAFGSGWFLLKKITNWGPHGCVCGTLAMLSVPMALQSHLALAPYSFVASIVLVHWAFAIELWKQKGWCIHKLVSMYLFWLLEILLLPEYLWFGAVPLLFVAFISLWNNRGKLRKKALTGVVLLGSILCIWIVGNGWQQGEDGCLNLRQMLAAKSNWSNLYELSGAWSYEVQQQFDGGLLRAACGNSEVFYEGFFDKMEQLPYKQQKDYLNQMIDVAWKLNGKRVVLEMAFDGMGYLMPAIIVSEQLDGKGFASLTGINYWYFIQNSTGLSSLYMGWYCIWAWLSLVLAIFMKGLEQLGTERAVKYVAGYGCVKVLLPLTFMAIACACFYTLSRIGVYDYKILSWWTVIWCLGTLLVAEKKKEE